jgi:hypothetical protein
MAAAPASSAGRGALDLGAAQADARIAAPASLRNRMTKGVVEALERAGDIVVRMRR